MNSTNLHAYKYTLYEQRVSYESNRYFAIKSILSKSEIFKHFFSRKPPSKILLLSVNPLLPRFYHILKTFFIKISPLWYFSKRFVTFILFLISDIILKVRPLIDNEVQNINDESSIISFLYPAQNQDLIKKLSAKKVNAFGEYLLVCKNFLMNNSRTVTLIHLFSYGLHSPN